MRLIKELIVYGNPQALKRHRTVRTGSGIRQYDPSKKDKADFLASALKDRPPKPLDFPIWLNTAYYLARPKSHYRTGKYAGLLKPSAPKHHITKPDIDNLDKFVLDALDGVFWTDDAIISGGKHGKYYSDIPRIEIKIYDLRELEIGELS